jgi:hypothetical protein
MRRGGLSGQALPGSGDGFDRVARRVHIDQDLNGDPLRSRRLVWLFRLPGVELLNLWLPVDPIVRLQPLALMSLPSLNLPRDVARFRANSTRNAGGDGGSFESDRLAVLHAPEPPSQHFRFKPNMVRGEAIVFPTGRTPHSAFPLPAEAPLAELMEELERAILATTDERPAEGLLRLCGRGDAASASDIIESTGGACEERRGQDQLCDLADRAIALAGSVCSTSIEDGARHNHKRHTEELRALRSALSRTSVEVRCITIFPHLMAGPLLMALLAGALIVRAIVRRRCRCRRGGRLGGL